MGAFAFNISVWEESIAFWAEQLFIFVSVYEVFFKETSEESLSLLVMKLCGGSAKIIEGATDFNQVLVNGRVVFVSDSYVGEKVDPKVVLNES